MQVIITIMLCVSVAHAYVSSFGYNSNNDRLAGESLITISNAHTLTRQWTYAVDNPIMASPITAPINGVDILFVNSYDGYLHAIVQNTGESLWKKQLSSYSGNSTTISRTTIAYNNGVLVFGDNVSCKLFFVNAVDGTLRRKIEIDNHPYCRFTQSPTISKTGYIYIGTSSKEEYVSSTDPAYPCCTFMGGLYKISSTGNVVWSFRTTPNNGGATGHYSGAALWSSAGPTLDYNRNKVYVTTGNNYQIPNSAKTCLASSVTDKTTCLDPNNYSDSILSIDMSTGALTWAKKVQVDVFNLKCGSGCTNGYSADADFMQGAILTTVNGNVAALITVQKNGLVYCVRRDNGQTIWLQSLNSAYLSFASAVDANHVYIASNGQTTIGGTMCATGFWVALNKNTGDIIWRKCNPGGKNVGSALTVTPGGVLIAGSWDGVLYAINTVDGSFLWSDNIGVQLKSSGAVAIGNMLIMGAGYRGGAGTIVAYSLSSTPATTVAHTTTVALTPTTSTSAPTSVPTRPATTSHYPSATLGNYRYILVSTSAGPATSQTNCVAMGGNLASITSDSVNSFISTSFAGRSADFWIGLKKTSTNGAFSWIDKQVVSFTKWATGQPNTANNNVAYINGASKGVVGTWTTYPASYTKPYLCAVRL